MTHWPKKSSLSRRIRAFTFDFISLSSSQTRTLIRSVELAHSNWNFSFHSGFNSRWIVFVRFRKLPICTVTYGSLKPVLSFACKPDQGFDLKFKSRYLFCYNLKVWFFFIYINCEKGNGQVWPWVQILLYLSLIALSWMNSNWKLCSPLTGSIKYWLSRTIQCPFVIFTINLKRLS